MIGKKVRELRKANNLTMSELANICKISQSYISDLENGKIKNPSISKIYRISNALGAPTGYLLINEPKNSAEKTIAELYGETEEEYELRKNSYPNTLSEEGKVKELVDFMLMSTKIINSQLISEQEKKELREIFKTVVTQWSKCMNEDDHNRAIQIYNLYSNITKID